MRARGLFPSILEEEVTNEAKIGLVVRQTPRGGEEAVPNQEVILVIGKRAAKVSEEEMEPEEEEAEGTTP